ncbi:MAG TPA: GldG family protein [Capillibacterium sp.]
MKRLDLKRIKERINESKRLKHGGYAIILTLLFLGLLIVVNLLAKEFSFKLDLTRNKLFSLSEQTLRILEGLDREVTIYGLYEDEKEDDWVREVIETYQRKSKKIHYKTIDPLRNPGFVKQYEKEGNISSGSLIVVSGDKYKVINSYDLINFQYNQYGYPAGAESLAVERQLTGALLYLTAEKNPVVYTLRGHDEDSLNYEILKQLRSENFEFQELNLLTADTVPEDADLLLVYGPKRDLTGEEAGKIRSFLQKSGRALFLMDLRGEEFPNFQSLFASYGVTLRRAVVVEGDNERHVGNPLWLLPQFKKHEITNSLVSGDLEMLLPVAQVIEETALKKKTVTIEPLLTSTEKAWAKVNLNASTIQREPGDPAGPFNLAVAVTDRAGDGAKESRVILVGNTSFLSGEIVTQVPGNLNFILNCFNWLDDREENLEIRPKSLYTPRLFISGTQVVIYTILFVVVIPLICFGSGLVVWLRRRHL